MPKQAINSTIEQLIKSGVIKEITNLTKLYAAIEAKKAVYCGFDPTSATLHIGHFLPIYLLKKIESLGCPIIIVIGGLTATIGDPSFRYQRRKQYASQQLDNFQIDLKQQLKKIFPKAKILNNSDWYRNWSVQDFMITLGKTFTVNKILEKKSIADFYARKELYYNEFSYLLLQAYDFYYLNQHHNCAIQIGGSDQFPNITLGIDLISKLKPQSINSAVGLTTQLIIRNGQKISKSGEHFLALNLKLSSLYQYFQFFYNLPDDDLKTWNQWLNLPVLKNGQNYQLQKIELGAKIIEILFGIKSAQQFQELTNNLINSKTNNELINTLKAYLPIITIVKPTELKDLLLKNNNFSSTNMIKRAIQQKAIAINQIVIDNWNYSFQLESQPKQLLVKYGKNYLFIVQIANK